MADIELKTSIILDQNGKPYVAAVQRMLGEVEAAGLSTGRKMGTAFSQLLTTGTLIRLAGAAYAFRRLAMAAEEPSLAMQGVKKDAHELAVTLGEELQAATGAVLSGLRPLIRGFTEADGSVHGAVLGLGAFTVAARGISGIVRAFGGGNWVLAAVAAALMVIGTGIGIIGEKTAKSERAMGEFLNQFCKKKLEEQEEALKGIRKELERINTELEKERPLYEPIYAGRAGKIIIPEKSEEQKLLEAQRQLHADNLAAGEEEVRQQKELRDGLKETVASRKGEVETAQDLIGKLNVQIALGQKRLDGAREDVKLREKATSTLIEQLMAEGSAAEKEAALSDSQRERFAKAKTEAERQKILTERRTELERELLALQQARVDLTQRIGQQSEKERSEAYHRLQLQAQIVDLLYDQGPLLEKAVAEEQMRKLLSEGHAESEIQVLDLKKQLAELDGRLVALAQQRREEQDKQTEATFKEWNAMLATQEAFARMIGVGLLKLTAKSDEDFRRRRIADLQKELQLTNLTADEIVRKSQEIAWMEQLGPGFVGGLSKEEADRQREALREIVDLLGQGKDAAAKMEPEIALIGQAMQQAAAQGSMALVQMFTRGKVNAENFAESLRQIFEQLLSQLVARGFLLLLASLIPGFGPAFGIAAAAGGGAGGMRMPPGGYALPTPQPALGSVLQFSLRSLERRLERIEEVLARPLQVKGFALQGSTIRGSLVREEAAAKGRKL